jgi:hypothetical protein
MTNERYSELLLSPEDGTLSAEEIAAGWHWCFEFDGMLVGPDMWGVAECECERTR